MATGHREETLHWEADPTALGSRRARSPGTYRAYIPDPIAELDPPLTSSVVPLLSDAADACRQLEQVSSESTVNLETLARQLLRAESVASSRIEGLIVSHRRLAKADFKGGQGDFTAGLVLQNIHGMEYAFQLATTAHRLTKRTFIDIHAAMFRGTRDDHLAGVIRDRQNWIGGDASTPMNADFVPPPAKEVDRLLSDLASFCDRNDLPPVLQAAIAHAQFETIHPFWDGNGRVGRALIHIVLRRQRIVERFLPPVSLVLAANAGAYVKGLTNYRYGDEAEWYAVFADALYQAAVESADFAKRIQELRDSCRAQAGNPRRGSATAKLIDALPAHPVVNLRAALELTGASEAAVLRAFDRLEKGGVIKQTTVGKRNRAFESVGLFAQMDDFERRLGPVSRTQVRTSAQNAPA
jgi:Fic family protein